MEGLGDWQLLLVRAVERPRGSAATSGASGRAARGLAATSGASGRAARGLATNSGAGGRPAGGAAGPRGPQRA